MNGKCYYCGKEFSKAGILRHIRSCKEMKEHMNVNNSTATTKKFILAISDKYDKNYYIYLAIDNNATLKDLDKFLRNVWLECCGHLSQFKIEGQRYEVEIDHKDMFASMFGNPPKYMNVKLRDVINKGNKLEYEYDFGSTTYLEIKVIEELSCSNSVNSIEIMGRNNEPKVVCCKCEKLAQYWDCENEEYLCSDCLEDYDEEDDMIEELGYMNSPRDGVCGYYGEKENEEPYLPGYKKGALTNNNKIFGELDESNLSVEKQFERTMLEGLKHLKKDIINNFMKQEVKKWSIMKKDFSLEYHLNRLKKDELLTIAKNLYINKVSSLKKEELKNKILELYEDRVNTVLENMDKKRFQYLISLLNEDGYHNSEKDNLDIIFYFRDKGIVFTGTIDNKSIIIMPEETQEIIENKNNEIFKGKLKRNEELIKLFWGMCNYYGVITLDEFKELLKKYIDYDITQFNLNLILKDGARYYQEFETNDYIGNDLLVTNGFYILSERDKREDLNFYPFKKEELLKAAEVDYIEKNNAYKKLYKFLISNFDTDSSEAEDLIFDLQDDIKNHEEPSEIIENFLENFQLENTDEINIIANEVMKFYNNTRHWVLKGYTPKELLHTKVDISEDKKVGRNDPCPCGSGKKYKKCCGK